MLGLAGPGRPGNWHLGVPTLGGALVASRRGRKQRGVYRGRPPRIDMEAIKQRLATGLSPTQIARELGVSRGTVYKAKADMPDSA